jgi:hypothetical protein
LECIYGVVSREIILAHKVVGNARITGSGNRGEGSPPSIGGQIACKYFHIGKQVAKAMEKRMG